MTYTPKHIEFDAAGAVDIRLKVKLFSGGDFLTDEVVTAADARVAKTGDHYVISLTGSLSPDNPSIPLTTDLLVYVSTINGADESPAVASPVIAFDYSVHPPSNIHFS